MRTHPHGRPPHSGLAVSKLSKLTELEEVDLSRNAIKESASLKDVFDKCKKLKKLSLLSNPVCKTSRGIEAGGHSHLQQS